MMILKTKIVDHKLSPPLNPNHNFMLCDDCWTGSISYCVCGGLIHNEFEDDNWDDVILNYECDNCGDNWEFKER